VVSGRAGEGSSVFEWLSVLARGGAAGAAGASARAATTDCFARSASARFIVTTDSFPLGPVRKTCSSEYTESPRLASLGLTGKDEPVAVVEVHLLLSCARGCIGRERTCRTKDVRSHPKTGAGCTTLGTLREYWCSRANLFDSNDSETVFSSFER
jgi:hypothetical protein